MRPQNSLQSASSSLSHLEVAWPKPGGISGARDGGEGKVPLKTDSGTGIMMESSELAVMYE